MIRTRGTVAYVGINGAPAMTSEFEVEPHEQEVIDLRNMIEAEGIPRYEAAVYALAVLVETNVHDVFVEWLSDGMFTLKPDRFAGVIATYDAVLDLVLNKVRTAFE